MKESSRSISRLQKNIYDKHPSSETVEIKDLKIRRIISRWIENRSCKILDVGCGDGSLLEPFGKIHECYGVDISEVQLKKAREKNITTFRVNLEVEELPFPQNFFDLIICSETIEHLLEIDILLCEVHRVLKFGGIFILTFPNVNQPISWLMQVVFDLPPMYSARYKSPHVRDYTLRIVKRVLADFGFHMLNVTGTYVYPFKGGFSQWLAKNFPRLAEKIIVVSKKHRKSLVVKPKKVIWNVFELVKEDK